MGKFALTTKRVVLGHVSVCQGCCCGNTANGKPAVPVEWLKKEWRARGLLKRIQLSISGCLGPCDIPNVVTISNESGTQWLGVITEFNQYSPAEGGIFSFSVTRDQIRRRVFRQLRILRVRAFHFNLVE